MHDDSEWDDPYQEPELGEALISVNEDGMVQLKWKADPGTARMFQTAIAKVAGELPRAPGTTDEQHDLDAFVEICRRYLARSAPVVRDAQ
jgi:hypothetical protein